MSKSKREPALETTTNRCIKQIWDNGTRRDLGQTSFNSIPQDAANELANSNTLQQYYVYYPQVLRTSTSASTSASASETPLLECTSIYVENTKLLPYTLLFRNSDQGHDFYTDARNVKGSFAYPIKSLEIRRETATPPPNYPYGNYTTLTANSTFGGGIHIFAILLVNDDVAPMTGVSAGTVLTSANIATLVGIMTAGKYAFSNQNKEMVFNISSDGLGYNPVAAAAKTKDAESVFSFCGIWLLPLYIKGYDKGMHRICNFNKSYKVYAIKMEVSGTKPTYSGYLLFHSKMTIPRRFIDMKRLTDEMKTTKAVVGTPDFDRKAFEIFQRILTGTTTTSSRIEYWKRGIAYQVENHNNKIKFFQDCLFSVLKQFHQNISYEIDPGFYSLLEEKQTMITRARDISPSSAEFIEKIHAFTTDTTVSPTERELISLFRQLVNYVGREAINPANIPYRYTITSNAIDGSGQGGQVYPSYHSPELDVYMNIFDTNNEYHGSVLRFSFLREVLSNPLNKKSAVVVELFYCYFDLRMFGSSSVVLGETLMSGDVSPNSVLFEIHRMFEYVLQNTFIKNVDSATGDFQLVTKIRSPEETELTWVSFKTTDAPSVEDINKATVSDNFFRKLVKIKQSLGLPPPAAPSSPSPKSTAKKVTVLMKDLYSKYFSCICMKTATTIDKILNACVILWEVNKSILQNYILNEESFYKIFLLRNKFIGDKSRATDALFMNKNSNLECIQSSNDENTLFTAFMYNMSSQWLVSSSSTKIWYLAPYINEGEDGTLRFLKISNDQSVGVTPPVNKGKGSVSTTALLSRFASIISSLQEVGSQSSQAKTSIAKKVKEKFDDVTAPPIMSSRLRSMMGMVAEKFSGRTSSRLKNPLFGKVEQKLKGGRVLAESQQHENVVAENAIVPRQKDGLLSTLPRDKGIGKETTELLDEPLQKQEQEQEQESEPLIAMKSDVLSPPTPIPQDEDYANNLYDKLKNSTTIILSLKTKYEGSGQDDSTIVQDLIYMLLDDSKVRLNMMIEPPIQTLDEMCEIINSHVEEKDISHMLDILNTFKPILDIFSQIQMLDEYGLSYTNNIFERAPELTPEQEQPQEQNPEITPELESVPVEPETTPEQTGGANQDTMNQIYSSLLDKMNETTTILQICSNWTDGHMTEENLGNMEQIMKFYDLILTPISTFLENVEPSVADIEKNSSSFFGLCYFYIFICDRFQSYVYSLNMRHITRQSVTGTSPMEDPLLRELLSLPGLDPTDTYFPNFLLEQWPKTSANSQEDIVQVVSDMYRTIMRGYETTPTDQLVQIIMCLQSVLVLVNDEFKETIIQTYVAEKGPVVCENKEEHIEPLNAFIKTFYYGLIFNADQEIYLEETDFKGEIREILDELCGEEGEPVQATKPVGGGRRKKSTRRKRRSLKKKSRKQQ
jgi:hypothetical protein